MNAIRIEMPKNTRNLLECFAIRFINAWLHIMSAVAIDMVVSSLEVVGFLVGIAHAKGLLLSILYSEVPICSKGLFTQYPSTQRCPFVARVFLLCASNQRCPFVARVFLLWFHCVRNNILVKVIRAFSIERSPYGNRILVE